MLYVAPIVGGYDYNLFQSSMLTTYAGTNYASFRCFHQTFMFQVYIMMNLFNMINCRVVDKIP